MKLVVVGLVVALVIGIVAFIGGWSFSQKSQTIDNMKSQMHDEHVGIAHRIDALDMKLDAIDKKLDVIVNIATRPSAFERDIRK